MIVFPIVMQLFPGAVVEYRFHESRRWRFDLAWTERMLAFEFEGGIFTKGRHTRPIGYDNDVEKYNEAQLLGWLVIRATARSWLNGSALQFLERAHKLRGT